MKAEYLAYPPQIADDVEIIEQPSGSRPAFIVGSASAGRFILLGEIESRVLRLLTGSRYPAQLCEEFGRLYGAKLTQPTLTKFLARLDEVGIMAGQRVSIVAPSNLFAGPQFYARWKLFNPDSLFEKMVSRLGWIWTKQFIIATLLMMGLAVILSMIHLPEVTSYALYTMREHYLAVLIAVIVVAFSHEFAHGLTCKAFGGRVPEVGLLMIYYLLPALYCNVSGAYLILERKRRLWVILAGIYWQVLVGAFALLCWFIVEPHTLISDLAFILFLGSVIDVFFNANPLIKLDGYYFLSQSLRLPNLMDRSRAYWSAVVKRIFFSERGDAARRWSRRERAVYAVFGVASFVYTVALRAVIVIYVGSYLTDQFNLAGLVAAAGLGVFYIRRPIEQFVSAIRDTACRSYETILRTMRAGFMKTDDEKFGTARGRGRVPKWRCRLVWLTLTMIVTGFFCVPWNASVGSYGTLVAIPRHEAVIRAPEDATLIELHARPGDAISSGGLIGRMGNLELEEQIVQAQSELARASADYERLAGELRVRDEAAARTELQLSRRRHEFNEINSEQEQINGGLQSDMTKRIRLVSASSAPLLRSAYPAAIAVLESNVELLTVQLKEATAEAGRSRELFHKGIVSQSEIESAQTRAAALSLELGGSRERLEAALIEHRRKYTASSIELEQAASDLRAERLQIELLIGQLDGARELVRVLDSRLDLLRRKQSQFELRSTCPGTVYGEDLPRMEGRYFKKGEEICRVADVDQMLVRIQWPEREISDVSVGDPVRLKVRAYPDRIFRGVVSKIGGESERDEHNQTTYRVELAIENREGLLRPGMTAFARVDFDRRMIGQILVHKVRQLLRPELWML